MTTWTVPRAHRAALDHALALAAGAPWCEGLVLRGSTALLAWLPGTAREPADLDWVVRPRAFVPVDPVHRRGYVDTLDGLRTWPEAAHGAADPELWSGDDHLDTRGLRARPAPEGLAWVAEEAEELDPVPFGDLDELIARDPVVAPGLRLDPDGFDTGGSWPYGDYGTPGVRVTVPWHADGLPPGVLRLEFSWDEPLPEPPVAAAVPRADGGPPTVVAAAGPALCLAWKLRWLLTEGGGDGPGAARGKDLYDAVLLAERPGTRLSPRLWRYVRSAVPHPVGPQAVRGCRVDGAGPGGAAADLLERLARALERT
ncbi:nucleotidyl transferase AbiEii/AbiGii toxin family protein [Kitasatospora sp. NPDC059571]|uniref:nucleotidyl transferase AbiEii/AbiGii toxin family protein n=1 Tax=Kitasatospora sp. NPDC059571 TaxID=3346871 RepID=UPI0036C5FF32